jgi:hypothetical protein
MLLGWAVARSPQLRREHGAFVGFVKAFDARVAFVEKTGPSRP